ncbi:HAMP domain-containing histidine kinase [Gracilibacillus oryzae]|uniref:histidine kinase n=1 Tax=Gracilibacillus oryzae TaxID=1672701 RepID=A0A7C8GV03_9BACI|nr:HAMP domain-containing sensor histidine kinase [Gracilibacillus oryzae]KAB8137978.1 HAMP domain-containing histidine kinase [Gracilibacillus oryzae]
MKLQYQLTIAFTTLLVIIMTIAGITIYSQMLQMLIKDEQRQLEDKGELIVNFILSENLNSTHNAQRLLSMLNEYNLQVFAYDESSDQIIFTSVGMNTLETWVDRYDLNDTSQPLWQAGNERFVVSILPIYSTFSHQYLVLLTPLDDLHEVRQSLIGRLMLIFFIGIIVAVLISHYLTTKLVTPLTKLRHQLKKIERRKFDEMEEIKATGEIKEVEQSVIEMANELNSFIQSQRHFFQNASHELKTPLMTIQGYAEGIRDGIFEGEDAERGLSVMVEEINRLKKIINEIILLAKLDSQANIYNEEKIALQDFMDQVMARAIPIANEKGVEVELKTLENHTLTFDYEKMLQAVMNIVTNAIRHTRSKVEISVYEKNKQIRIEVRDNGNGIEEELLQKLFHRFVKGDSGETGLGLAIARAIVEHSGGTIKAENHPEGGAVFCLQFVKNEK